MKKKKSRASETGETPSNIPTDAGWGVHLRRKRETRRKKSLKK